jgi:hypothetical protein
MTVDISMMSNVGVRGDKYETQIRVKRLTRRVNGVIKDYLTSPLDLEAIVTLASS